MTEEHKNLENEHNIAEDSQPLCIQCLTPFEPLEHYCKNCGSVVGNSTRYLPFVNIPFEVQFSEKVWRRFWHKETSGLSKICLFPFLITIWGPLFLVGLPFELLRVYKNRKT